MEERRPVRAIARRRSALVAEPRGCSGNAASVRARRRDAAGMCRTPPSARSPCPLRPPGGA
ncbi:hypothetical protein B6E66_17805 [Streptomyces maremycinicus]|nr:hypothetical protein B6E66_17805 [Streptomyces sp. B9173]